MRMRYKLCYRERSGKESYGETRIESGKATVKTFYAELAWCGVGSGPSMAANGHSTLHWQIETTPTNFNIICKIMRIVVINLN